MKTLNKFKELEYTINIYSKTQEDPLEVVMEGATFEIDESFLFIHEKYEIPYTAEEAGNGKARIDKYNNFHCLSLSDIAYIGEA